MPLPRKQNISGDPTRGQIKKQSVSAANAVQRQDLPVKFQQAILNVFIQACPKRHDLKAVIQEVKGHLFNRDFNAAFSKPEYLDAYALRWSAARALAYTDIFARSSRNKWFSSSNHSSKSSAKEKVTQGATLLADHPVVNSTRVVCIGGGAGAEIVALASVSRYKSFLQHLDILAIDIADWTESVNKLNESLTAPPPISAKTSEADKIADHAFLESGSISVKFLHKDILDISTTQVPTQREPELTDHHTESEATSTLHHAFHADSLHDIFPGVTLCTMMFTLNELFSTSIPKTTAMLLALTHVMDAGSWLVVVDSPGSYSEIKLGKTGEMKKYPMKWLLDHTLLDMAGEGKWTKREDEESVWFRIEDKSALRYPLELENMRYQIHVYQRR